MTVAATIDSTAARRAMIDSQLRVSGVNQEAVLAAMNQVEREQFVPAQARAHAYIDRAIRLDAGHALPAPLVHGLMLAEAAIQPGQRVLVVSCGSNYLPALVEAMGASVEVAGAAEAAAGKPGSVGCEVMLIDGAIELLPAALVDCLADGARVVTGLSQRGVTSLARGTKIGGQVELAAFTDIGIPVLAEFAAPKSWSF
jgi:protein-L-isoaspartate(D-aspartate) O-methyltransferase